MATFTCWCGYVIRDNSSSQNAGRILWHNTDDFYSEITVAVQGFYDACKAGNASGWLKSFFGQQYPTDASSREVIHDVFLAQSLKDCSGFYRCPECRRVYIHITGTENRWESFVPENKVSGDE
jgi:hypothetical protein